MDPIISPWTIFWPQALMNLDGFNHLIFPFICLVDVIWFINFINTKSDIDAYNSFLETGYEEIVGRTINQEEKYLNAKKNMIFLNKLKYLLLILIIFSILCIIFIPSKEMMIAIIASSYVTPDNINAANEVFKANLNDYVNIIANAIKK